MIAVKGIYDGKTIKPLEPVLASPNARVIITFLEDEKVNLQARHRSQRAQKNKYPYTRLRNQIRGAFRSNRR